MKTEKTPLFRGIGETALAEMFTCGGARCKTYAKGEVLLRAGCITREVGVVRRAASTSRTSTSGATGAS